MSNFLYLEYEEQDLHDLDIEIEPQDDPDLDPTPILNQKPKWDEKLIEATRNDSGDPDDKRKKRSEYQNDYIALSYRESLSLYWCNKL